MSSFFPISYEMAIAYALDFKDHVIVAVDYDQVNVVCRVSSLEIEISALF